MTDASRFKLTLLTRDPIWAAAGELADVDYIGVDIERIGKRARHAAVPDARINDHELSDLQVLRIAAPQATLWARLNPLHSGSPAEVERALAAGAQVLTLPQFTRALEIEEIYALVSGRARIIPLLEDAAALEVLEDVLTASTDGELMIGLNDLSRSLGMSHPLQLVTSSLLVQIGAAASQAGVEWGFGGVAAPGPRPDLPVQPDDLLSRYAATGAKAAWISRSMIKTATPNELPFLVSTIRQRIAVWRTSSEDELNAAKIRLERQIERMIQNF